MRGIDEALRDKLKNILISPTQGGSGGVGSTRITRITFDGSRITNCLEFVKRQTQAKMIRVRELTFEFAFAGLFARMDQP